MYSLLILCSLLMINHALTEQVPFRSCSSVGRTSVMTVIIHPCKSVVDNGFVTCRLEHGRTIRVQAAVLATFNSEDLETVASATINNRQITFTNSGTNPCKENVIPECPVKTGQLHIFTYFFDVLQYYPTGRMEILFAIRDRRTNRTLACVKLPVIIKRNYWLTYDD